MNVARAFRRGLLVVVCLAAVSLGTARPDDRQTRRDESCGPQALATAFALLGRDVELSQCASLAATSPEGLTTLAGLKEAARALGESAYGMRLRPRELAMLGHVAILHAAVPGLPHHYVVFRSCHGGRFAVINPTRAQIPQHHTGEQLSLMWDGSCLVFTKTPVIDLLRVGIRRAMPIGLVCVAAGLGLLGACCLHRALLHKDGADVRLWQQQRLVFAGFCGITGFACLALVGGLASLGLSRLRTGRHPRLLLGTDALELGDIPTGAPTEVDLWVANRGKADLRVDSNAIKASCTCVKGGIASPVVPPGDKRALRIYVGPKNQFGPFEHALHIRCDNPRGGARLTIRGNIVGPAVACPPRLYFGAVGGDGSDRIKSFLYLARYPQTRVTGVASDSPYVACRLVEEKPGIARFEAALTSLPAGGPFQGVITLTTTDPRSREVTIPFSGVVTSAG